MKSEGVQGNCSGEACLNKLDKCQNGGQCVDLLIKTECDCEGTGYYGEYCEQSGEQSGRSRIYQHGDDDETCKGV